MNNDLQPKPTNWDKYFRLQRDAEVERLKAELKKANERKDPNSFNGGRVACLLAIIGIIVLLCAL